MNKKLLQLITLLHEIQDSGRYTVFYEFAGHVKWIYIKVYQGKWEIKKKPIFKQDYKIENEKWVSMSDFPTINIDTLMNELSKLQNNG